MEQYTGFRARLPGSILIMQEVLRYTSFVMTSVDLTITARAESVSRPWLWQLGQDFRVKVNIVKANIDTDYGWAHVVLEGPLEEVQRATAWLMTTGLHVEAKQRAVGA
ncbi:MAG: NIL domain-containing protein [Armatimonadetes bacterium]|nr:NIL domain-containing protein [Armatimonadota bacterium]